MERNVWYRNNERGSITFKFSDIQTWKALSNWLVRNPVVLNYTQTITDDGWGVKYGNINESIKFLRAQGYTILPAPNVNIQKKYEPMTESVRKFFKKEMSGKRFIKPDLFSSKEIEENRKYIHDTMVEKYDLQGNFTRIGPKDLERLWNLYDEVFFGGEISRYLKETNSTLKFQTTPGGNTKLGGWCRTRRGTGKRCTFTISIPAGLYFKLFNAGEKNLGLNGLLCWDRLTCLQIVLEHEGMHLLMQLYEYERRGRDVVFSPHGKLFKCMVKTYFGHTRVTHGLLQGEASEVLSKDDFTIGDIVTFTGRGGMVVEGVVIKKNPSRARVKVGANRLWNVTYSALKKTGKSQDPSRLPNKDNFKKGDTVQFADNKGKIHIGTVERRNPAFAKVMVDLTYPRTTGSVKQVLPRYPKGLKYRNKYDILVGHIIIDKDENKSTVIQVHPKIKARATWSVGYAHMTKV